MKRGPVIPFLKFNIVKKIMKIFNKTVAVLFIALLSSQLVSAHCEIPCGIYGDQTRIDLIKENITTIEKSMKQINELSSSKKPDQNQLVRWVINKEEHAKKIQDIVSQYFLHQRIKISTKPGTHEFDDYLYKLTLCHQLLVYSMKCKQSTDLEAVKQLRESLSKFESALAHKH